MFDEVELSACMPQLGTRAPDFTAQTTFGDIKLSDFRGKWVVLFSHPGDFTPVCTTEFLAFTMYFPKFVERNVQLIGLSIDSLYAHLGWVYNIYKATGIEIPFPIIADLDMRIAKKYGMISPTLCTTSTIRTVFIIDDKQIIRAILQYPITTGRYIPEILRIIDALKTADCDRVATPANWLPGLPVIEPAPRTYQALKERLKCPNDLCCLDWYLCFKDDTKKFLEEKVMEMPMMENKFIEKPMPIPCPQPAPCPPCPQPAPCPQPPPCPTPPPCPQPVQKPVEIEKVPVQKAPAPAPVPVPVPVPKPIEVKKPVIKGKG